MEWFYVQFTRFISLFKVMWGIEWQWLQTVCLLCVRCEGGLCYWRLIPPVTSWCLFMSHHCSGIRAVVYLLLVELCLVKEWLCMWLWFPEEFSHDETSMKPNKLWCRRAVTVKTPASVCFSWPLLHFQWWSRWDTPMPAWERYVIAPYPALMG